MKYWEYQVIEKTILPTFDIAELLNGMGLDRWELCGVLYGWDKQTVIYHFKRPMV